MSRFERALALAFVLISPQFSAAQQDRYQRDIPRELVAQMEGARTLRRQGRTKEAAELLHTLVQAQPDYYLAQYNLGIALADTRDYAGSAAAFGKAVTIKEEKGIPDASVYNSAGWSFLLARDYKKAEEFLLKGRANADQLSPDSRMRLENNLGLLYLYSGELDKSAAHLEQARAQGSPLATKNLVLLEAMKAAKSQPPPK